MADLEERIDGEALVQLCSQAREGLIIEKDIARDLFGDVVHRTWIAQSQRRSFRLKACVYA